MIFFEHILFWIKNMFPPQKKFKRKLLKNLPISRKSFFFEMLFFCLENSKKMKDTRKTELKKKKKQKNTNAKKVKGQMKNRKEFLLSKKKMEQKSRGDERSFVFFKDTIFRMSYFFKKTFFERKKTQAGDGKTFFLKSWRDGYFSNHEMIT